MKPPLIQPDRCGNCKFFEGDAGQGICRARPPVGQIIMVPIQHPVTRQQGMQPQPVSTWPPVPADGWCGEFAVKIRLQ